MIHISNSYQTNRIVAAERCLDRLFTMMYRTKIMKYDDYIKDIAPEMGGTIGSVRFVNKWLRRR